MTMIWTQTLKGKAFDLLNINPAMIDFAEIAEHLATINRYAGAAELPVSVALHTLIVADAVEAQDRPYALLHDAHEAYIGDIITPAARALKAVAEANYGPHVADAVQNSIHILKRHLDMPIWRAAGLAPPDEATRQRIATADIVALRTERRDFLARSPRPWSSEIEAAEPLRNRYRWRAAPYVADDLKKAFKTYLPALQRKAA